MNPSAVLNRRVFQTAVGSAVLGGSVAVQLARVQAEDSKSGDANACQFAASFMTWDVPFRPDPRPSARHNIPHGNLARIDLEALIDVIDRLEMAHVVYNRLDRAEFLLRRPTPVPDADGQPLCHVLHFSEVREDRAVNELLACDEA
jgi:hypothetical protein